MSKPPRAFASTAVETVTVGHSRCQSEPSIMPKERKFFGQLQKPRTAIGVCDDRESQRGQSLKENEKLPVVITNKNREIEQVLVLETRKL